MGARHHNRNRAAALTGYPASPVIVMLQPSKSLYLGTLKAVEPAFTLIASFACSPSGNFLECIFRQQPDPTHIFLRRCGYGNQCTLKNKTHKSGLRENGRRPVVGATNRHLAHDTITSKTDGPSSLIRRMKTIPDLFSEQSQYFKNVSKSLF